MLSASYIRSLPGDPDCIEALAWLAEHAPGYPSGLYTPPLEASHKEEDVTAFVAMTCRIRRDGRDGAVKIGRIEWQTADSTGTTKASTAAAMARAVATSLLCTKHSGKYIVTSGANRHVLDTFLETLGPSLLTLGYSLQPCVLPGGVSFIIIRKGKRSWRMVYFETQTGMSVSSGLRFASPVGSGSLHQDRLTQSLYTATAAAYAWLGNTFGVAARLTLGMTALACARRYMPATLRKWRPTALLMGMERLASGYRGGVTYGRRYRGPTWRIDVNRQYTHALRADLPATARFAHYNSGLEAPEGAFMCRVRLTGTVPYPLGVWSGAEAGFVYGVHSVGTYVCVLHSSEFAGLRAMGAEIIPEWGYAYTETWNLSSYADALQSVLDTHGRGSAQAEIAKALGNYVYGKFGQRPDRNEVLFSEANPDASWHPFFDNDGNDWVNVWERKHVRYTSFQHADIAATITGAARSQTVSFWAALVRQGYRVVRCHTDSLTVDKDPSGEVSLSETAIGGWRLESHELESIIIGPNAYFDEHGAHIAGVTDPTYEMIDTLYDGSVVTVVQDVNFPRHGWRRGKESRSIELRAGVG